MTKLDSGLQPEPTQSNSVLRLPPHAVAITTLANDGVTRFARAYQAPFDLRACESRFRRPAAIQIQHSRKTKSNVIIERTRPNEVVLVARSIADVVFFCTIYFNYLQAMMSASQELFQMIFGQFPTVLTFTNRYVRTKSVRYLFHSDCFRNVST